MRGAHGLGRRRRSRLPGILRRHPRCNRNQQHEHPKHKRCRLHGWIPLANGGRAQRSVFPPHHGDMIQSEQRLPFNRHHKRPPYCAHCRAPIAPSAPAVRLCLLLFNPHASYRSHRPYAGYIPCVPRVGRFISSPDLFPEHLQERKPHRTGDSPTIKADTIAKRKAIVSWIAVSTPSSNGGTISS